MRYYFYRTHKRWSTKFASRTRVCTIVRAVETDRGVYTCERVSFVEAYKPAVQHTVAAVTVFDCQCRRRVDTCTVI